MPSTCLSYSNIPWELWRSRGAVEGTRCQNRWPHSSSGKRPTHYWDLRVIYCVLGNDVYRAHFNWAVWGKQEFVRWKGTEISCQRDCQQCITGHPRNRDHRTVVPAQGGGGRVRTEVRRLLGESRTVPLLCMDSYHVKSRPLLSSISTA